MVITSKELLSLILASIILAFSNSFIDQNIFFNSLAFFIIILFVYSFAKKLIAYYFESETEEKIWTFERYGFQPEQHFKNPIPIGIIISFIVSLISFGTIKWFAVTESEINPTVARVAKRHDFYSYSELTEWHIALISSAGIFALLILSFLAYLINLPEFAKLCVYFAAFNLLPLGKLDGTKIFFGSRILYFTMVAMVAIAVGYALLLV